VENSTFKISCFAAVTIVAFTTKSVLVLRNENEPATQSTKEDTAVDLRFLGFAYFYKNAFSCIVECGAAGNFIEGDF